MNQKVHMFTAAAVLDIGPNIKLRTKIELDLVFYIFPLIKYFPTETIFLL